MKTATTKRTITKPTIKVADEVWVATLMLHQRYPERPDFLIEEIVEFAGSAKELRFMGPLRPGFYVHVVQHCVANRPPNPGRNGWFLEPRRGAGVCFAMATHITLNERAGRFRLNRRICPKTGSGDSSRGIAAGVRKPQSEQSTMILC